jgi:hypothetical protein
MKRKLLLALTCTVIMGYANAQKKSDKPTAYAITGTQMGNRMWTEVKLIDLQTGEVISPVYESKSEVKRLNARTKKPISVSEDVPDQVYVSINNNKTSNPSEGSTTIIAKDIRIMKASTNNKGEVVVINQLSPTVSTNSAPAEGQLYRTTERRMVIRQMNIKKEEPFATSSAALAFDKKNNRLYYTPMGINQLRYIDLKAKTPTVCYFENENFGKVKGMGDVQNQITRMVIGSDGNGYALTNKADELIQFTTKKKPVINNLGAITDDVSNGRFSVSSQNAYGGDMIADNAGNLYLITASRRVYRINIETRVAKYLGSIKGLPGNYTTNGAIVENENSIIVTSSTSTAGYYRFTLENLQAELVSTGGPVFNASDLANGNLLSANNKKEEDKPIEKEEILAKENTLKNAVEKSIRNEALRPYSVSVYPNPITNYQAKLSFTDYPEGKYEIQVVDLTGRQITRENITVNTRSQVQELRIPSQVAKGTYFLRILNSTNMEMILEKLVIQ